MMKMTRLFFVGLVAAVLVYPFLHEMGHVMAAFLIGVEAAEIQLWPFPSILCCIDGRNQVEGILVGFGGIALPFFLTLGKPSKRFWAWYLWFVVKSICVLAFGISLWSIVFFRTKAEILTDDMNRVMQIAPEYGLYYGVVLGMCQILAVAQVVRSGPIDRYEKFFGG